MYDEITKFGRNEPCPCGSGKKYKKCCMNKKAHGTQEDDFTLNNDFIIDNQISDYGIPEINDAFFDKNPFKEISAAKFLCFSLVEPGLDITAANLVKQFTSRSEAEEKRIKETNDITELLEIMRAYPDTLNQRLLVSKILQYKDVAIPTIIDELKHTNNNAFTELAIKILYETKNEYSNEVLKLIKLPVRNPYTLSSLCLLLGLIGHKEALKTLWDCYHFLKERSPRESFAQGPLLGLYELYEKGYGNTENDKHNSR
mgnify:CR=1 FL=1